MALFVNPGKDWEKNMSEEDIAQMESQGYDVTELRAKRAKSAEEEEKERLREKEERENFKNPTNLNKLAPVQIRIILFPRADLLREVT